MADKLTTPLLISGFSDPLPAGAIINPQDEAEAAQLRLMGYLVDAGDTDVTHQPAKVRSAAPKPISTDDTTAAADTASGKTAGKK